MKKWVLIVMVLVLVFSANAFAAKKMVEVDDGTPAVIYDNCIYTNIYPWFILWANIAYERAIGPYLSVKVNYSNFAGMNAGGAEILFHPMGKSLEGFYLGPKYDAWIVDNSAINWLGGIAGYGFIFQGGVLLKLGVGYLFNLAGAEAKIGSINFFDKWPAVDLGIGWAF